MVRPQSRLPPLFDRLLDADGGGSFAITPKGPFRVTRAYRPGSNVLETTFITPGGRARLTESLNSGPAGRLPWSELARRVEGIEGRVDLAIVMKPGTEFGTFRPSKEENPNGDVLHLGAIVIMFRAGEGVRVDASNAGGVRASCSTSPGSRSVVALLAVGDGPLPVPPIGDIDGRIDRSDAEWREWTAQLTYSGPYPDAVRRSALALKLLINSPTGAIAAAATTSLPERVGGGKNYDYRFAWIRDVAHTVKAFLRVGALQEAKAAFAWMLGTIRRHGPGLHVLYTLGGDLAPARREVGLPGYRGSGPVCVGNDARSQEQLGMYGDILEAAGLFVEKGHILDEATRRLLVDLADRCAAEWTLKDAGIWELGEGRHYTMSKIGCWLALDRAAALARGRHIDPAHADRWARERDKIRDWINEHCWSDAKQSYTQSAGSEDLDASLLLATRFGFVRRDRLDLTRAAVRRELCRGPLVYRYSGTEAEEGAFLACSFWLVEAHAFLGRPAEARRPMDELLAIVGGNLGLLGEMVDPGTRASIGNFPQGLSHLAMIHAALAIAEAVDGRGPVEIGVVGDAGGVAQGVGGARQQVQRVVGPRAMRRRGLGRGRSGCLRRREVVGH